MGPEFEAMVLFPSFHVGIYHPLDQEYHASSIKASFGIASSCSHGDVRLRSDDRVDRGAVDVLIEANDLAL